MDINWRNNNLKRERHVFPCSKGRGVVSCLDRRGLFLGIDRKKVCERDLLPLGCRFTSVWREDQEIMVCVFGGLFLWWRV